jgi:signal transduction histidine kinase
MRVRRVFDRLSIRNKILVGLAVLVIPLIVLAAVGAFMTRGVMRDVDWINDNAMPTVTAVSAIQANGLKLIQHTTSLAFLAVADDTSSTGSAMRRTKEKIHEARAKLAEATETLGQHENVAAFSDTDPRVKIAAAAQQVIRGSINIERLIEEGVAPSVLINAVRNLERFESGFDIFVKNVLEMEQVELSERQSSLQGDLTLAIEVTSLVAVVGTALAVLLGFSISNRIATPVTRLRDAARRVGAGDLNAVAGIASPGERSGDEVGQLATAFQEMTANLRDANDKLSNSERLSMLGLVAGTVSHELRNPLGAIASAVALIRHKTAGNGLGLDSAVERVDRNIDRCNRIIGDLLEFTRKKELAREPTAIDAWLAEMLGEHQVPADVELRRDLRSASDVAIDADRFRQVVVNLVDNAAQALTDRGWQPTDGRGRVITVRTEAAGPHVKIAVADNGPGIPAERIGKIFQPLFTTKSFGVGLGLPTVRQLVEQHGGTIDVDSKTDEGTIFTIWLPRAGAPVSAVPAVDTTTRAA